MVVQSHQQLATMAKEKCCCSMQPLCGALRGRGIFVGERLIWSTWVG
jgi:hypothetical protein